jgi:hypothetical protein
VLDDRVTLITPDNYRRDFLEIELWDQRGQERARESLYVEEEDRAKAAVGIRCLISSRLSGKWQAAIVPPPLPSSGGSSTEQISCALGQRV